MKKIIAAVTSLVLVLGLVGCSGGSTAENGTTPIEESKQELSGMFWKDAANIATAGLSNGESIQIDDIDFYEVAKVLCEDADDSFGEWERKDWDEAFLFMLETTAGLVDLDSVKTGKDYSYVLYNILGNAFSEYPTSKDIRTIAFKAEMSVTLLHVAYVMATVDADEELSQNAVYALTTDLVGPAMQKVTDKYQSIYDESKPDADKITENSDTTSEIYSSDGFSYWYPKIPLFHAYDNDADNAASLLAYMDLLENYHSSLEECCGKAQAANKSDVAEECLNLMCDIGYSISLESTNEELAYMAEMMWLYYTSEYDRMAGYVSENPHNYQAFSQGYYSLMDSCGITESAVAVMYDRYLYEMNGQEGT